MKKKKIIKIFVFVIVPLVLGIGGFMGWFLYQIRDMHPLETAKISDSVFVIKGDVANTYLVKNKDVYVVFDAGDNPEKIAQGCKSLSIDPASIVPYS